MIFLASVLLEVSVSSKSARYVTAQGYIKTKTPFGWRLEHVVVAERALGKRLPPKAVVHHADGDKTNNDPGNLVICQDRAYHNLLEKRIRAYRAVGKADWRMCQYCRRWDAPENLYLSPMSGGQARHRSCACEVGNRKRHEDIAGYRERRRHQYATRRGGDYKPKLKCRKPTP